MAQTHPGTALVTGASSGIGALYADRLAQRGYDLILVARNRERLNALANTISTRSARAVEVLPADLGDCAALARVEDLLREDASITLLVNNAGIGTHTPLLQSDVEQMTRMVDLNVTAPMRLAYAVAPAFVARGRGAIINIASIVAIAPELLNGVYGGSKASCWRSASRCGTNWPPPACRCRPSAGRHRHRFLGHRRATGGEPGSAHRDARRGPGGRGAAGLRAWREAVTIPRCMPARNGTPTTPRAWPWLASCPAIPLRRAMRQPVDVSLDPGSTLHATQHRNRRKPVRTPARHAAGYLRPAAAENRGRTHDHGNDPRPMDDGAQRLPACGHAGIAGGYLRGLRDAGASARGAKGFTTLELKSNFLGTAKEGVLSVEAVAEHLGRSTQVWSATVVDGKGRRLSLFRCSQIILW